jgi:hypothetical protein
MKFAKASANQKRNQSINRKCLAFLTLGKAVWERTLKGFIYWSFCALQYPLKLNERPSLWGPPSIQLFLCPKMEYLHRSSATAG